MTTITINEKTKAGKSFLEFAKNLPFVKVNAANGLGKPATKQAVKAPKTTAKEQRFYKDFEVALKEVKQIREGKIKPKSLKSMLNDL